MRPQLRFAGADGHKDFIIRHEADKGLSGLIDLRGMELPGLTASPYIAKYIAGIVNEILEIVKN